MAESAALDGPLLLLACGDWALEAAARMRRVVASATVVELGDAADGPFAAGLMRARLGVLFLSRASREGHDGADALTTVRARFDARSLPHLAVERDAERLWVGPSVVPGLPGCHSCWEARRRQHGDWLAALRSPVAASPSPRLAAAAALAVARRLFACPAAEAGVVRRLPLAEPTPSIGRVVPVRGCRRCDPLDRPVAGWSLARARTPLVPTPA